jgi:predicted amidohydrolase
MRITLIQPDVAWRCPMRNIETCAELIARANPAGGGLIVLPEMFATGFAMDPGLAEAPDGPARDALRRWSREYGCWLLAGLAARDETGAARNAAVLHDPQGRPIGLYAKTYPFPLTGEGEHFPPGHGPTCWQVDQWRLVPGVCYDLRFPELFRRPPAAGAELLVVLANWPTVRLAHWRALLVARAIENQAFVAGVNRVGSDPNVDYPGGSMIVDPRGQVLVELDNRPGWAAATIDLDECHQWRRTLPALADAGILPPPPDAGHPPTPPDADARPS